MVSEEEWDDALELKFKNVTFTFTLKDEQRGDGYLNLKLTQDGSLYQKSEGLGWGNIFIKSTPTERFRTVTKTQDSG